MPEILVWPPTGDPRPTVQRAAQALREGQLVAFPTETVYGIAASALVPEAVERLSRCKGRAETKPMALAIRGADEALDWVPGMGKVGRRLARRCWPGPVTLVYEDGVQAGLASRLEGTVRERVCPGNTLGLRVPAHEAILLVLESLPGPLVLTSANRSGEPEAIRAEEVAQAIGEHLALVIDDGPSRHGQASTVVRVNGDRWSVVRQGVVPAADLEWLAGCMIVFVCTGNTCRSPLAEGLCKKLLAERLGCTVDELPRKGFLVRSAGLAAMRGNGAAYEAIETARELGADLTGHISQPVTAELVAQADYLVAMTQDHARTLMDRYGVGLSRGAESPASLPRVLCPEEGDVADPVGCDFAVYQDCARQIAGYLERLVPELQRE
jgi:tRNA threonylcarbamoyl adenosine modification protein (Sua5/YciO/YrdC/YwlC family)